MGAMELMIAGLGALGAGAVGWSRRRSKRPGASRTVPALESHACEEICDDGESGRSIDGQAAFYAYQMAASRVDRD